MFGVRQNMAKNRTEPNFGNTMTKHFVSLVWDDHAREPGRFGFVIETRGLQCPCVDSLR
jgi:hypothetical protein